MNTILILRHSFMNLDINIRLINRYLDENQIESELIAPKEFCSKDLDRKKIPEIIKEYVDNSPNIQFIFFEANLGYPSEGRLSAPTIDSLLFLIDKFPDAIIILISNTEQAITSAHTILNDKNFPSDQVIHKVGAMSLSEHLKNELLKKLGEPEGSNKTPKLN